MRPGIICALTALLASSACGSDGGSSSDQAARGCEASCSKLIECNLNFGLSKEQCVANCTSGSNNSCNVSDAEANACISATESFPCDRLAAGEIPNECANLCPDQQNDTTGGTGATDVGSDASGSSCQDLAACCAQLTDATKQACDAVVSADDPALCAGTLDSYRNGGFCD